MAYIYQNGLIDGRDVRYWHKQYIERRNKCDELSELVVAVAAWRGFLIGKYGDTDWKCPYVIRVMEALKEYEAQE